MPVTRSRSSKSTVPSLSFLHWFSPHLAVPAGASWNSEMVLCVRFQNRVGLSAANALVAVMMSPAIINMALCMAVLPGCYARLAIGGRERKSPNGRRGVAAADTSSRRINDSRGGPGCITKGIDTMAVGGLTILFQRRDRRLVSTNEVLGMATRVLNTEFPADHLP